MKRPPMQLFSRSQSRNSNGIRTLIHSRSSTCKSIADFPTATMPCMASPNSRPINNTQYWHAAKNCCHENSRVVIQSRSSPSLLWCCVHSSKAKARMINRTSLALLTVSHGDVLTELAFIVSSTMRTLMNISDGLKRTVLICGIDADKNCVTYRKPTKQCLIPWSDILQTV